MLTIIQTTSDSKEELDQLANDLVEGRLAACGQVDGPISSTYVWDEVVKQSEEYRLTLKTTKARSAEAQAYITEHHSYDIPEIISFEAQSTDDYERWVAEETS